MKRLTLISLILGMVLTSCKEYGDCLLYTSDAADD